jgi:hypothetical protein
MNTSTETSERILIGHIGVDSGQVMIGDPCYLDKFNNDDWDGKRAKPDQEDFDFSYAGACQASLVGGGPLGKFLSVVSSTAYGDGIYPVYQVIKNGELHGLYVAFGADEDDDDE